MMTLCPNHHSEADHGGFSEERLRGFKAAPINLSTGFPKGRLSMRSKPDAVRLGGLLLLGGGDVLSIDDNPVLSIQRGAADDLELSVQLRDRNDNPVAMIDRNEWQGDARLWDIESRPQFLRVRLGRRQIALTVDCRKEIVSVTGNLWMKGQRHQITDRLFRVNPGEMDHTILGTFWALLNVNSSTSVTSIIPHPSKGAVRIPTEDELENKLGLPAYREWKAVEEELRLGREVDKPSQHQGA